MRDLHSELSCCLAAVSCSRLFQSMVLLGAKEFYTSRHWLVLLLGTGWSFFSVLAGPARYWLVPSSHLSEPTIQREVSLKPGAIPNSVRPVVLSVSGLAR